MKNFTYFRPDTAEKAVALLERNWGTTELLGGGTDLHDLQKEYVAQPTKVISLGGIKNMDAIAMQARGDAALLVGAGATLAAVAGNSDVKKHFPALADAAGVIGTPQIRNVATVGGNLCQRNRCWYFRDEHVHCLLKDGDKCYALDGENRYHAVFTKGHKCVIVSPSTLAPVLIALDAVVEVLGPGGGKNVAVGRFFKAPVGNGDREHMLAPNELVTAVRIPVAEGRKNANYEVHHKVGHDWPLVQAAVSFGLDGERAKGVKVVLGHVAPTPHVAEAAAKAVEGKAITEESAEAAGKAAALGAAPLAQNAYKLRLIAVAVKRALLSAAGGKKYWEA
jgi:xanthine dehydrogenase YagS FAD-binding subunit